MKSLTRSVLVMFLTLYGLTGHTQIEKVKGGLPVTGAVTQEGKRCENATITIYDGNEVVNTFHTPRNGRFQLLLFPDKFYTLEVQKSGFVAKRISIDTSNANWNKEIPVYECDLDIVPALLFNGINISDLDFPMAIVRYDPKRKEFDYNEDYTSQMRSIYEQLIIEGFARNGTAMK